MSPQPRRSTAFSVFARAELEQSLPARFEQQVERAPEQEAVRMDGQGLTYAELEHRANRVAHALLEARGPAVEPVALLLRQGPGIVAAILGTLKAGKQYVPFDPTAPRAHLASLLAAAAATTIVTDGSCRERAEALATEVVVDVDALEPALPDSPPGVTVPPRAPAYIFFTSGSTGTPKGVVDSHRNVLHNVMRYTNSLYIAPDDRLSLLQSAAFSGSVSSLFCALLNGATVCLYDVARDGVGAALGDWVERERLTVYHSVPTVFRSFLTGDRCYPDVRVIRLEGDAASALDVELFRRHFAPECVLVNGLGATETGLTCQLFVDRATDVPAGALPLGLPVVDMDVRLLDDAGSEVANGATGELAIRSEFLALGYWRDQELSESRFAADAADPAQRTFRTGDLGRRRADGVIEYLGRKDFLLKVRGHRVEPAVVEAALLCLPEVEQAVVATPAGADGRPRLVAYVVPVADARPEAATLRRALAESLPDHLVPTAYVLLDALPLGPNGKVDRRALPDAAPRQARTQRVEQPASLERRLTLVWESVLGTEVGPDDDFFDLGGDSIAAAELLAGVGRALDLPELPLSLLLEAPTVARLGAALRSGHRGPAGSCLVPFQPAGLQPPFFCVHGHMGNVLAFAELARLLGAERPFYGLQAPGLTGETPLDVEGMAARFLDEIMAVAPHGPYHLGGYCFGGIVAFELAGQLRRHGEEVGLLALLDTTPADFPALAAPELLRRFRAHARRRRAATHAERLLGGGIRQGAVQTGATLRRAVAKARFRRALRAEAAGAGPLPRHLRHVDWINDLAAAAYRPQRYAGAVTVFAPQETFPLYGTPVAAAWSPVATSVTVVEVTGAAGAMFRRPHVGLLADRLGAALREA